MPETVLVVVMVKQTPAGFLKLFEPLLPGVDRVVLTLGQRFPGNVVFTEDLWRVEISVVDTP